MKRSFYSNELGKFGKDSAESILGHLAEHNDFDLNNFQKNAWIEEIKILKSLVPHFSSRSFLSLEYSIPRMGKRVDAILIIEATVFVLEFKIGEKEYKKNGLDQALDYAVDLKNFHEASHSLQLIPILISSNAPDTENDLKKFNDEVYEPLKANSENLLSVLNTALLDAKRGRINYWQWHDSRYMPTPTIIQAAQALYGGHGVSDISRSDSGTINLSRTSDRITDIIESSKQSGSKSICFVTGVPGAGKTLAGLNIANQRHNFRNEEHAVFLSGNGPLVKVLQEALARDEIARSQKENKKLKKGEALSRTKAFIQNIHYFRDEAIETENPPLERVVIFDEAQRAWNMHQTSKFMQKRGLNEFNQSEPDFLLSVMNRHPGYAVIICLVGSGQEINSGEAGISEWFRALYEKYSNWMIYSPEVVEEDKVDFREFPGFETKINRSTELHLSTSVRSFRAETVSEFVRLLLLNKPSESKEVFEQISDMYPIFLTRDLGRAKKWLIDRSRGSERRGVIASSGAIRLRPDGINVKVEIDPVCWFLNDDEDVRSSQYLEEVATEFKVQGLELDWSCVAWGADLRMRNGEWSFHRFSGTRWQKRRDEIAQDYLLNAYRVLLTRARQGMVIFVPNGDANDHTRPNRFYDETYKYLVSLGISDI